MATEFPNSCFRIFIESVIALTSLCDKKFLGILISDDEFQIGLAILTVGQLSFSSHCISQPKADDSWIILKYGEIESKPNSVWPVAESLAANSGS